MLSVADAAFEHVAEWLKMHEGPDHAAVRLFPGETGIVLKVDTPHAEDTTFDHDGRTLLVLDAHTSNVLWDKTLDVQQTADGEILAIRDYHRRSRVVPGRAIQERAQRFARR